jgi:hypothetical protein
MWRARFNHDEPIPWEQLFAGYRSCVDWPSAYYWRELIQAYPQAKVILTYRSSESWWKSFEQTVLQVLQTSQDQESLGLTMIGRAQFGGRAHDRAHAISVYEANVAAVKATVPPERLLIHELGDGWEPLCKHLGVPVPSEPYPSRNKATDFQSAMLKPR